MIYKIKLTQTEIEVLSKHLRKDLDYGWDGTFGGYEKNDKEFKKECLKEMKIGNKVLEKLIKARF
jgi:hypothetical protein